jgi:hypothetical protein
LFCWISWLINSFFVTNRAINMEKKREKEKKTWWIW